tara:strand:+ start:10303 stop:11556 length:1254 start_codon:yes stop_codon:yes gene_type:complete
MQRILVITILIIAGEVIFALPFHIARFFRPTFLEVFQINNTQLGDIFASYGIVAMLSYFPGGLLADRFSARFLLSVSLIGTSVGGFYLYTIPPVSGMYVVFAIWGATTILLFWSAMIKATREWGGSMNQGLAFGLLDGGRGLVASLMASLAVIILSYYVQDRVFAPQQQREGLQSVIAYYSIITLLVALAVWFFLKQHSQQQKQDLKVQEDNPVSIFAVLRNPKIWWQAGIVITAYCGYKGLDNYGLYATQVLDMGEVESAAFVTYTSYSRPIVAVLAGFIADRWRPSSVILFLFLLCTACYLTLYLFSPSTMSLALIISNLVFTIAAVYALRGIYFALLEEGSIKSNATGTATGLISLVGFTPDVFFAPLTGRILDANPGLVGFQHYFLFLSLCAFLGLISVWCFTRSLKKTNFST